MHVTKKLHMTGSSSRHMSMAFFLFGSREMKIFVNFNFVNEDHRKSPDRRFPLLHILETL